MFGGVIAAVKHQAAVIQYGGRAADDGAGRDALGLLFHPAALGGVGLGGGAAGAAAGRLAGVGGGAGRK